MTATDVVRSPVPAHVPADLVVDFDGYRPMRGDATYHEAYAKAHVAGVPDIFWSPYNGGHWMLTRREHLAEVFGDYARFSSAQGASVDKVIKPHEPRLAPIEVDPPEQQSFRKLFASAFTVPALKAREAEARALAISLIEDMKPRGRCEFVQDFAQHLPVKIFMQMVDVPERDRMILLEVANNLVAADSTRAKAREKLFRYAAERVAERCAMPGDDLISKVATAQIDGRTITQHEATGVIALLLVGGLDTVASMMSHIMLFLASHAAHRQQLATDPSLSAAATEEFLRRFALTSPGRTVIDDTEFHGVVMKAADKVMLATPFGAVDPSTYPDPLRVDFARKSNNKTTFGAGPHVCPGSMLARIEIRILLEEWLPRIPDFSLDPQDAPRVRTGVTGSVEHLPLVWAA